MADFPEVTDFAPTVPKLERTTKVKGGIDGASNAQAKALTHRTANLKKRIEDLAVNAEAAVDAFDQHVQGDSHQQYLNTTRGDARYSPQSELGQPNGTTPLGPDGLVPALFLSGTGAKKRRVTDQAARLALAQAPHLIIAYQDSDNTKWILPANTDPSVAGNWHQLGKNTLAGVNSFNGRQGAVSPLNGDYSADQITETANREFVTPAEKLAWSNKQEALAPGDIKTVNDEQMLASGMIRVGMDAIRTPTPTAPANGAVISGSPILTANRYAHPHGVNRNYREFQVDLVTGDFSAPIATYQYNANSRAVIATLQSLTEYKWRCRDVDVEGMASEWSAVFTFNTPNISIQTPYIVVPVEDTDFDNTEDILESSAFIAGSDSGTHVATYWRIKNNVGIEIFNTGRDTTNLTTLVLADGIIGAGQIFFVSVRYENSNGILSEWSNDLSFLGAGALPGNYVAITFGSAPYLHIYKRDVDSLTKLPDPAAMPDSSPWVVDFSLDGNYLVMGMNTSPGLLAYKREGDTFTKMDDPDVLPTMNVKAIAVSPDGMYVAYGDAWGPFLAIYKRDGNRYVKLPDLAVLPTDRVGSISFSYDGVYLAVGQETSPSILIYKREGDVFTKLPDPVGIPTDNNWMDYVGFSPLGNYLVYGTWANDENHIGIFKRDGDTFTKLPNPAQMPPNEVSSISFTMDELYMACGHWSSPFFTIYKQAGDVFTKLPDPDTLPPMNAYVLDFSGDGTHLVMTQDTSPYIMMYRRDEDVFTKLADPDVLPTNYANAVVFGG